jgi:hypothetical protein
MLAVDLLDDVRADLTSVEDAIRSARFVDAVAAGTVREQGLRAMAGEQRRIIASDRRSFAQLAARFPSSPAHDWFLSMEQGESEALALLDGYAGWLAIDEDWFGSYEPKPRAQAYPAFVAWLALNGFRRRCDGGVPGQPRGVGRELRSSGGGPARRVRRRRRRGRVL